MMYVVGLDEVRVNGLNISWNLKVYSDSDPNSTKTIIEIIIDFSSSKLLIFLWQRQKFR